MHIHRKLIERFEFTELRLELLLRPKSLLEVADYVISLLCKGGT